MSGDGDGDTIKGQENNLKPETDEVPIDLRLDPEEEQVYIILALVTVPVH